LRRGAPGAGGPPPKQAGPLAIDTTSHRVTLHGEPISLTATEYKLLEFFFSGPGRVYSREQLLRAIWGDSTHVTPRNVDVHIRRLRERIEEEPENPKWIQTVRGFGYRFDLPA
jgi:two-component system phosphate regulon response regulator PhoB